MEERLKHMRLFAWMTTYVISTGLSHAQDFASPLEKPQSKIFHVSDSKSTSQSLSLRSAQNTSALFLMGRTDMKFEDKLWTFLIESHTHLAFHSDKVSLQFDSKKVKSNTHHYRYNILFDGIKLDRASLTAHFRNHLLINITTSVPKFSKVKHLSVTGVDFHQAEEADGKVVSFAVVDDVLTPLLTYIESGYKYFEHYDTGEIVASHPAGFNAIQGSVQLKNDVDSAIELEPLRYLENNGIDEVSLANDFFYVTTDHEIGPVQSEDGVFDYSPYDRARFDQVAIYHNLAEGIHWFQDKFKHNFSESKIKVTINTEIDANAANAAYVPAEAHHESPELLFGRGETGKLINLARDKDVSMHELAHHVIYKFINDKRGTAASLHEGFADYFTYAFSGDPNLAEQVVEDGPYLRTAQIDDDKTYDNPYVKRNSHSLGQVWSAYLWEMRTAVGAKFDDTVYQSLHYLNASSGFGDAIEALLLADRDQSYNQLLESDESDSNGFGPHRCDILHNAVRRGYAGTLSHLDASDCDINIASLQPPPKKKGDEGPMVFRACAQISHTAPFGLNILLILLGLFPLISRKIFRSVGRRKSWN